MTNANHSASGPSIQDWAVLAARAADSKKAIRPIILNVGNLLAITESFVIVSAANGRLVKSIADEIEMQIKQAGGPSPRRIEGMADASWVLMDYGDFVVHVFLDETRDFYDLERLWADAPTIEWEQEERQTASN